MVSDRVLKYFKSNSVSMSKVLYFRQLNLTKFYMGNFNRGGGFGGRDRGPKQMHHAVCDNCGKDCEVPFKPTGDKPVLCSDCFSKSRGDDDRGSRRDSRRGGFGDKTMYIATCDNCGNRCEVPFRPTPGKPVLCDNCFSKNKPGRGGGGADMTKQFEMLGAKLDQILEVLGASESSKEKKASAVKEAKEEKKASVKKTAAKKTTVKKTAAKKPATKKASVKKTAAKKKK